MSPIDFNPAQKAYSVQESSNEKKQKQPLPIDTQSSNELEKVAERQERQREAAEAQEAEKEKQSAKERKERQIEQLQDATNELLSRMNIKLDFKVHKETDQMVVKVRNKESNEVIRQIPPEEMLELAKRMEEMSGMLLDKWS
jgi:flagellar protein FlaG